MCSQVLPCPLCCKPNFDSIDALKISLVKVTNRPLHCPICNEMLFGLDKLTIHLFSHSLAMDVDKKEEKENTQRINSCKSPQSPSSTVTTAQPRTPMTSPSSPPSTSSNCTPPPPTTTTTTNSIKCDICDFLFDNQRHLSMHMNLVHVVEPSATSADSKAFPCHLCNKSFKMKGSLRVHLRVVHSHGFQNMRNNKEGASRNNHKEDHSGANGTVRIETEESRGNCAATETQRSGAKQKEPPPVASPDQSKSWICDICTKSFTTKYFLKKHKRLHTGEMPYACSICGKTFTFQQSYHKHLLYHSDEKPHVCGTCGRAFKELSTLHNHERIHSGEKPFKCETCGEFNFNLYLINLIIKK